MKIQTSRFGMLDVPDKNLLIFPFGLVGFPACRRFVVLDAGDDSDYQWFQSVDDPWRRFSFYLVGNRRLVSERQQQRTDDPVLPRQWWEHQPPSDRS